MQKKTILHFIADLGRGGAETMLVQDLKELDEYNNIVVTLNDNNHFENELQCAQYICLNKKTLYSIPSSVYKFRKLIKKIKPDLVHSHLIFPNFIARLATPRSIPLINTIHNSIAHDFDYKKWIIRWLDKFTYWFRKPIIIGVSKVALRDYFYFLKVKQPKSYLLYTFVNEKRFIEKEIIKEQNKMFKIVSVGALRNQKNFNFFIEAFSCMKNPDIQLHIYGHGPLENELRKKIEENSVLIILKGEVKNLEELLPFYDAYVSSSVFEGFSLAVLEAMAMKLPLLLTDIDSFREQCEDAAIYYRLNDKDDFLKKLNQLVFDPEKRRIISEKAQKRVLENFTLPRHISALKRIYAEIFVVKN